jgi:hypothetical protein
MSEGQPGRLVGRAMTADICSACWGSGDADAPYLNLFEIRRKLEKQKSADPEAQ